MRTSLLTSASARKEANEARALLLPSREAMQAECNSASVQKRSSAGRLAHWLDAACKLFPMVPSLLLRLKRRSLHTVGRAQWAIIQFVGRASLHSPQSTLDLSCLAV